MHLSLINYMTFFIRFNNLITVHIFWMSQELLFSATDMAFNLRYFILSKPTSKSRFKLAYVITVNLKRKYIKLKK